MLLSVIKRRQEKQRSRGIFLDGWVYSDEWIRPFESIWSILQTLKYVNMITDKDICDQIGARGNINIKYDKSVCMYVKTNVSDNTIKKMLCISEQHTAPLENVHMENSQHELISSEIRICPECMKKHAYHSFYHQLLWINKCPWHGCRLQQTGIFYGIGNKKELSYGLRSEQLPTDIPLPSNRERFAPTRPNILDNIRQLMMIGPEKSPDIQMSHMKKESSKWNLILSHDVKSSVRYTEILRMLESRSLQKDQRLNHIFGSFQRKQNTLNESFTYYYDNNYFTYKFISGLVEKYKGDNNLTDILCLDLFEFYKEEAADPLYAALMFAVNLTKAGNLRDAIDPNFYIHSYSKVYGIQLRHSKWIDDEPFKKIHVLRNESTTIEEFKYFELCIQFEIQFLFMADLWEQYLTMLGKGIIYADLSSHLKYPFYLLKENLEGNWFVKKIMY